MDTNITVESYIAALGKEQKHEFERIKKYVDAAVPNAELVISYGMPTFKCKGKVLLHFGAFKNHMSIFPGGSVPTAFVKELEGYSTAKGTIQFTPEKPLSDDLLARLIAYRVEDIG